MFTVSVMNSVVIYYVILLDTVTPPPQKSKSLKGQGRQLEEPQTKKLGAILMQV